MLKNLIDKLSEQGTLEDEQFLSLLHDMKAAEEEIRQYLYEKADAVRKKHYRNDVYIRGLIEFTNYCKNDCYYCGIRRSNRSAERYRLTKDDIMVCCEKGYHLGFRTFVLQGGEDAYFTDEKICEIISSIKKAYPDCAVTLSIGEKTKDSYQAFYDAGASRYLLRQETADAEHYGMLHPAELTAKDRQNCLFQLKEIGYQVGCGIMVGSPGQTEAHILADLRFMETLQPHMIGIGPFIPHKETPFAMEKAGTVENTLMLLSILRLMFPKVLLPATTSLATICPKGRELGMKAGANVVMPNLSPLSVREKYTLYDGKLCAGNEASEHLQDLRQSMSEYGYRVVVDRGDHISMQNQE